MLRSEILVVFAMREEAANLFNDVALHFTGIGKVNAAYHLTAGISEWKAKNGKPPALVLNLGSAGSDFFKRGDVVNPTRFIQRDMDVSVLGYKPFQTPLDPLRDPLTNGLRLEAYPEGYCGTGDSFVTTGTHPNWNLVDMEAYALAKVCANEQIPFASLKFISDGADGQASDTFGNELTKTAGVLRAAFEALYPA